MTALDRLKGPFAKLYRTGFFHIFGAGTINKAVSSLTMIVLVWLIPKAEYGLYSYVFNIVSIFALFNGLGASSALLQLCCEHMEDRPLMLAVFRYGERWGRVADVALAVLILVYALVAPGALPGSQPLLALYCLYPLVVLLCELRLVYLRSNLDNRAYAYMTNVQTLLLAGLSVGGALVAGVPGLIAGQYAAYAASFAVLAWRHPLPKPMPEERDRTFSKREYWYVALVSSLNNGLIQALSLSGTFFVGQFLASDVAVASYKVATAIPFALSFAPTMLMTYAYPRFAAQCHDGAWTRRNYLRLTVACVGGFGALLAAGLAFGPQVIGVVFGEQYLDAVPSFRILMVGFFVTAALRQPATNFLVTQKRLLANTVMAAASIALNVVLSVALVPRFQMEGAAWAYTASMALFGLVAPVLYWRTVRDL